MANQSVIGARHLAAIARPPAKGKVGQSEQILTACTVMLWERRHKSRQIGGMGRGEQSALGLPRRFKVAAGESYLSARRLACDCQATREGQGSARRYRSSRLAPLMACTVIPWNSAVTNRARSAASAWFGRSPSDFACSKRLRSASCSFTLRAMSFLRIGLSLPHRRPGAAWMVMHPLRDRPSVRNSAVR